MDRETLQQMSYVQLQSLAKRLSIKANMKAAKIIEAILNANQEVKNSPDLQHQKEASQTTMQKNIENQENDNPLQKSEQCNTDHSSDERNEPDKSIKIEAKIKMPNNNKKHKRKGTYDKEEAEMGHLTPTIETPLKDRRSNVDKQKLSLQHEVKTSRNTDITSEQTKKQQPMKNLLSGSKIPQLVTKPVQRSVVRTPNFARIHQRAFEKMDSLDEYMKKKNERLAKFSSCKKISSAKKSHLIPDPPVMAVKDANFEFSAKKELSAPRKSQFIGKLNGQKITSKTNNHAELFKKSHRKNHKEEQMQFIKGVRTNKRFLLQMKARGVEPSLS